MAKDELRKQFVALQKEFLGGGPVSKMRRHEIEHRMAVLRHAMSIKAETPEPDEAALGAPSAREVKTKKVAIDAETEVTKPMAPTEGGGHGTHYKRKPKAEAEAAPVVEKPAPPKKVRKVPPKVVLAEEGAPVAPKPKAAPKPKSKATAPPKTDLPAPEPETPPAPAPAPVVEKPAKLPGGCRRMPDADLYLN